MRKNPLPKLGHNCHDMQIYEYRGSFYESLYVFLHSPYGYTTYAFPDIIWILLQPRCGIFYGKFEMSCDGIPVIIPESSNAGPGGLTINFLYHHPEHAYDFVFSFWCLWCIPWTYFQFSCLPHATLAIKCDTIWYRWYTCVYHYNSIWSILKSFIAKRVKRHSWNF